MKRIYFEFFHVSKHGKVSEKVMLTRIAVSIAIIIACMAAMSFAAYAYFSYGLYSDKSTIVAANYELSVKANDEAVSGIKSITETTEFTVTPTDDTNATVGYCKIDIITTDSGNNVKNYTFYTAPIWREADAENNRLSSRTVKIEIPDGNTTKVDVLFTAEWGTYSGEALSGDTITADLIGLTATATPPTDNTEAQENPEQQAEPQTEEPPSDSTTTDAPSSTESKTEVASTDTTESDE